MKFIIVGILSMAFMAIMANYWAAKNHLPYTLHTTLLTIFAGYLVWDYNRTKNITRYVVIDKGKYREVKQNV